uniref:HNOB domain-containing protein n=1 Tax=Angiostrongylus cantonensis TaxID=6313 RepID=A0A0K0D2U2_ANGCA
MHYFIDQIAFKSEMRGPTFQCESVGDGSLRLHYFSHRQGLFPIVKGLVRQTAHVLFDINVVINFVERSQERRKGGLVEHVVFCVEPDEEHRPGKRLAHKFKRDTRALSSAVAGQQALSIFIDAAYHIDPLYSGPAACRESERLLPYVPLPHLLQQTDDC